MAEVPLSRTDPSHDVRDADAERGEAGGHGDTDLSPGDLTLELARGQALARQRDAVHPGLGAASAARPAPASPVGAAEALRHAQEPVAGRDDGSRPARGDGVTAISGDLGAAPTVRGRQQDACSRGERARRVAAGDHGLQLGPVGRAREKADVGASQPPTMPRPGMIGHPACLRRGAPAPCAPRKTTLRHAEGAQVGLSARRAVRDTAGPDTAGPDNAGIPPEAGRAPVPRGPSDRRVTDQALASLIRLNRGRPSGNGR